MNNPRIWQRAKRNSLVPAIMGLVLVGLSTCSTSQSLGNAPGGTQTLTPTHTTPTSSATNLDDDASQWGIFYDGGSAIATVTNVPKPSVDGNALKASLLGGQPYVGIHVYRNLPPADTATSFELNLSFNFPSAAPIQALEFTMNTWVNNQRWEWAVQWENIGSGNISHGQVQYISFSCDSTSVQLSQTFAPVSLQGDKLAAAVQLDGDSHEDPYQVYIDRIDFSWR